MTTIVDWAGKSGATYRYWAIDYARPVEAVSGNYCFAKQLPNGNFTVLYFGETKDLNDRIGDPKRHECWAKAVAAGVTHVMAHTTPAGEQARCAEEKDLIERWNPPLNVQHKQVK